ncbi:MAG TPA: adenylate/guanylate cyclase domain-containing protein, partial [Longimicrobiaceae bacterium]|nr:adenylate/guanylate cyclase domain-containing protein [Longimicrobiaceae bacterium]
VDKYLGDQIMALFGAPMARGDDAARAVRAAIRIQRQVAAFSAEREARGEAPVRVGIGINTGAAVAGFVGSPERLNYTVLGESVNVAARLCSVAAADESLLSHATRQRLGEQFLLEDGGPRMLKGLSQPVDVYRLLGPANESASIADDSPDVAAGDATPPGDADSADGTAPPDRASSAAGASAAALVLALLACPALVQGQALPTLGEAGVRYSSPGGWLQIAPSGRIDLTGYAGRRDPSWLVPTTDAFLAPRASVFVDAFLGARLYARAEARADRGEEPAPRAMQARVEQAFVRWTPLSGVDAGLQAGKFASPFGAYPQRHGGPADAFIRAPFPYEYRTVICAGIAPATARGFLTWRDQPQVFRPIGAPVIWAVPYQAGVMASGAYRGIAARVAVMNSAPSSPPPSWNPDLDADQHPSVVAGMSVQVVPELRVGLSYDRGAYLRAAVAGLPGAETGDFDQTLWGAEASFARGRMQAQAEVFIDRWQVPHVQDDPRDVSYTVETRMGIGARSFVAARFGGIGFNRISDERTPVATSTAWDYGAHRAELAAGLATGRNTQVRAEYQLNTGGDLHGGTSGLAAVQWAWTF